jgi:nicotinamide-nucleotide amidase
MAEVRTAEIIAVGSELLTPYRSDTNSLFLTARLNELGIDVRAKAVVGDDRDEVGGLLRQALARAELVLITGGLGPTDDDVTREAVAGALGRPLDEDAALLSAIRARFAARQLVMSEINRRQAQVIRGATPLANANGTAPGQWIEIEHESRVVVLLPGPPREMQPIFTEQVAPRLAALARGRRVRRRVIKTTGRAESQVDEVAQPIYSTLGHEGMPIQTTILAKPGQVELHLSATGEQVAEVDRALEDGVRRLSDALGSCVFSVDDRSLEEVVGDRLRARGFRIAVGESCTGGLVLGRLTDVPGSSAWVAGGVVAYADEVKTRELGVPAALIAEHGAVSQPVAVAMAEGARARLASDVGVAVTGIAGPSGGSDAKPVGTVFIAVAGPRASVRTFRFVGDRRTVRQQSVAAALDMVRRSLD